MAVQSAWLRMPFIVALAAIQQPARCDEFLAHNPVLQLELASQIDSLFGEGAADSRVQVVEARMRPMFGSLPKDHNNRLGQQAVRYALHRYFTKFHSWSIVGLRASANATTGSSPVIALDDRTPQVVKDMVHGHLEECGFGLRDLANVAVMMELFAKMEVVERLADAYNKVGFQTTDLLTTADTEKVINYNYIIQLLSGEVSSLDEIDQFVPAFDQIYAGWADTKVFISDMRRSIEFNRRHVDNPFTRTSSYSFDDIVDMTQVMNDRFGQFQNFECRQLKDALLERELGSSGRIRLHDFYSLAANGGDWRFSEKADYLRELGALDDSDTRNGPSVIIANYLHSQTNCLASSKFYSICCLDECEDLLGHLEDRIAAPEAAPEVILAVVSMLSSSTVAAPRNISSQLVSRLHEVAAFHGGAVPFHGRLFAQWMHHAYPRECPYPNVSGSKEQVSVTDWSNRKAKEEGVSLEAASGILTPEELQVYLDSTVVEPVKHSRVDEFDDHHGLPHVHTWVEPAAWLDEEKLFAGRRHLPPWARLQRDAWTAARNVAMLVALSAVVVQLAQNSLLASSAVAGAGGYGKKGQAGWEKLLV